MKLSEPVVGKAVRLRSTELADAPFVLGLRLNPALNQYVGPTDPSVELQEQWIRDKQDDPDDCNMIIEDLEGRALGTIAIYDIDREQQRAEWGRWIIDPEAPFVVPFESAMLMYHTAFYQLGLQSLYFGVQNPNQKVINFHKGFGSRVTRVTDTETWFEFDPACFQAVLEKYAAFHAIKI